MPDARRPLDLNEGAQTAFVHNDHRYSAFIGGLGSGKTFAGLARAMKFSAQVRPKEVYWGARGVVATSSYRLLQDAVIPLAEELIAQTGLANWSKDYRKSDQVLKMPNGAEILFRSLDQPDKVVRGPELSWVFIDEGRNVREYHWKLVLGRLRQKGYNHAAWVCSTPNGHDWMWKVFHPASPDQYEEAEWYGAPTHDNSAHLPEEYIRSLEAAYEGRFYEQEVLGHFVGVIEGAVFPYWEPAKALVPLEYRPELPLYTFWDFGYGDPGVCIFAQIEWTERQLDADKTDNKGSAWAAAPGGSKILVPTLTILDAIEHVEWTSADWADAYHEKLQESFNGRTPTSNFGDPAGRQRQGVTGSSYIEDLEGRGVTVNPAPKRAPDRPIRLLNNMMAAGRVLVNSDVEMGERVSAAISEYHWKVDSSGVRVGNLPVHDWTSHIVDAMRYGAVSLLGFGAREGDEENPEPYKPWQYGYVLDQLERTPRKVIGGGGRRQKWDGYGIQIGAPR